MAKELKIELVVDAATGMATIKSFTDGATDQMKKIEGAGKSMSANIASSWQGMTVATAAAIAGVATFNQAVSYMDIGAKALQIESSFEIMSNAAGINGALMTEAMEMATKHTIDDSDLMSKAVKLMLNDYKPDQIVEFSRLAVTASQYAGVNVGEAFEMMNDAIANKTPKALVKLGAMTKDQMKIVTEAVQQGADSHSLYELSVANLTVKQLMLQGTQNEATLALQRYHKEVNELTENIGKGLIVGMTKAWGIMQGFAGVTLLAASGVMQLTAGAEKMGARLQSNADLRAKDMRIAEEHAATANALQLAGDDLLKKSTDTIEGRAEVGAKASAAEIAAAKDTVATKIAALKKIADEGKNAADKAEQLQKQIAEATRRANVEIQGYGLDAYEKEMIRIESEKVKWQESGALKASIAKWYTAEISIAENKMSDEVTKLAQEDFEIYCKYLKERDDKKKKDADDRVKAERDIYKDVRGYENDHYTASIGLIESQAKKYKDMGVNQVAIARWVEQETIKAEVNRGKASDSYVSGWIAGLDEIKLAQTRWGEVGYASFKGTMTSMSKVADDLLFDGLTNNFRNLSDYWNSMWTGMLRSFTSAAGKMASEKLLLYLEANWTDAGKSTLGIVDKLLGFAGVTSSLYKSVEDMNLGQYLGVSFAHGGLVPGYSSGGDSPSNDIVPAWLSPGEFVIPRSGVNSETKAILDYIRAFGRAPGYADGGMIGTYTQNEDGTMSYSERPEKAPLTVMGWSDAMMRSFVAATPDFFSKYTNLWSYLPGSMTEARILNKNLYDGGVNIQPWNYYSFRGGGIGGFAGFMNDYMNNPVIWASLWLAAFGGPILNAAGFGSSATAGIGGMTNAGLVAGSAEEAFAAAGMTASEMSAAGLTGAASTWTAAEIAALSESMMLGEMGSSVGQWAAKQMIPKLLGGSGSGDLAGIATSGGMKGKLNLSLAGGDASGISKSLSEFMESLPKRRIISAQNGLDFVPEDNTLINAHRGEAILNAADASMWRSSESLLAELQTLREELARANFVIAKNTGQTSKIVSRWDGDGIPAERIIA